MKKLLPFLILINAAFGLQYQENVFESQVSKAIQVIKRILNNEKFPIVFTQLPHNYDDKYILANFLGLV
jgi:hypothetical protein